jgi:hypothetical protein
VDHQVERKTNTRYKRVETGDESGTWEDRRLQIQNGMKTGGGEGNGANVR